MEMIKVNRPVRVMHTETPVREIWSMLSFFESEHNAETYLKQKFGELQGLSELRTSLAYTIRTAGEYYTAAENVTDLTSPLLLFYGMTNLAKVLFMATHGKLSPSRSHGLLIVDESFPFQDQSVRVTQDGTFPQFHGCFSKQNLDSLSFSLKELLSLIPEIKVNFETVYNQKSNAIKVQRHKLGISLVDSEFQKYGDLNIISKIPEIRKRYGEPQFFEDHAFLFSVNSDVQDCTTIALSGEEYLVLPLTRGEDLLILPEMSVHFLIMFILGILSRYASRQWLDLQIGSKTGEIYIVQKFLEVTTRKFPNLILNELHDRQFVFTGPRTETGDLTEDQLDKIYDHISRRMMRDLSGY